MINSILILFFLFFGVSTSHQVQMFTEDLAGQEFKAAGNIAADEFVIKIDAEGNALLDAEIVTLEELRARLKKIAAANPNHPVRIEADNKTNHQNVKNVMDECTGVGLRKISFLVIDKHRPVQHPPPMMPVKNNNGAEQPVKQPAVTLAIDFTNSDLEFVDIEITKDAIIYNKRAVAADLRKEPVNYEKLDQFLTNQADIDVNATIIIRCSPDSSHGVLMRVLTLCNKHKLSSPNVFSM